MTKKGKTKNDKRKSKDGIWDWRHPNDQCAQ
nr:MAG TPA: hypothetical protein [Caudoviricetes sp.]